jgi:hypothetical protein
MPLVLGNIFHFTPFIFFNTFSTHVFTITFWLFLAPPKKKWYEIPKEAMDYNPFTLM